MSNIEWTDETWNPMSGDNITKPLRWRKPRMVRVTPAMDLFDKSVSFDFIDRVFAVLALCPQHTFQVLTKRPERMEEYLSDDGDGGWRMVPIQEAMVGIKPELLKNEYDEKFENHAWPLPNVWLGTSIENQQATDERIPHLLRCPAAVRFLSCEPLLGGVDLPVFHDWDDEPSRGRPTQDACMGSVAGTIDWVIVGGESGPGARQCDVAWIRSIVRQCKEAEVPCFVKQLGANIRDRNDAGFDADECQVQSPDGSWHTAQPEAWPSTVSVEHDIDGHSTVYQGKPVRVHLGDKKGGDMNEWPEDLRVREWPKGAK